MAGKREIVVRFSEQLTRVSLKTEWVDYVVSETGSAEDALRQFVVEYPHLGPKNIEGIYYRLTASSSLQRHSDDMHLIRTLYRKLPFPEVDDLNIVLSIEGESATGLFCPRCWTVLTLSDIWFGLSRVRPDWVIELMPDAACPYCGSEIGIPLMVMMNGRAQLYRETYGQIADLVYESRFSRAHHATNLVLSMLDERRKEVLIRVSGLLGRYYPITEVAKLLGVSSSWARQILIRAKRDLRYIDRQLGQPWFIEADSLGDERIQLLLRQVEEDRQQIAAYVLQLQHLRAEFDQMNILYESTVEKLQQENYALRFESRGLAPGLVTDYWHYSFDDLSTKGGLSVRMKNAVLRHYRKTYGLRTIRLIDLLFDFLSDPENFEVPGLKGKGRQQIRQALSNLGITIN